MRTKKLFCTFVKPYLIQSVLDIISSNYEVEKDRVFIFKTDSTDELILSYSVFTNKRDRLIDDTKIIHRKKETNTLYTLNAMNILIKRSNNGVLDKKFKISWENYQNTLLITRGGNLKIFPLILDSTVTL